MNAQLNIIGRPSKGQGRDEPGDDGETLATKRRCMHKCRDGGELQEASMDDEPADAALPELPTMGARRRRSLAILGPLVLATDLVLLLGREVVGDVEGLADLLGRLALDHVGDGLAADVQQGLDVEVVGGEDDLEQHLLVDLHELLVPLLDVGGLLATVGVVVGRCWWVALVVLAPLDDLLQDALVDLDGVLDMSLMGQRPG